MLCALDFRLDAVDVVIVHPRGVEPSDLVAAVRRAWTPNIILTVHQDAADLPAGHPAANKPATAGMATAYVCRGESCSLPVTDPRDLDDLLAGRRAG